MSWKIGETNCNFRIEMEIAGPEEFVFIVVYEKIEGDSINFII